jgi:hypothetical protein
MVSDLPHRLHVTLGRFVHLLSLAFSMYVTKSRAYRLQFAPDSDKNAVVTWTWTRVRMRSKCMSTKGGKSSDKKECQAMMIAMETRYV